MQVEYLLHSASYLRNCSVVIQIRGDPLLPSLDGCYDICARERCKLICEILRSLFC